MEPQTTSKITNYGLLEFENSIKQSLNFVVFYIFQYVHDGSESTDDSFSVKVAVSDEKESAPVDIEVKVNPVNNQRPLVIRNTGIKVWKGGIGLILSDNLSKFSSFYKYKWLFLQLDIRTSTSHY